MCLAIPMRLIHCREWTAVAELDGVTREIGLALCPEAQDGDYVLVHAGFAIARIDAEEAATTLALLAQLSREEPS